MKQVYKDIVAASTDVEALKVADAHDAIRPGCYLGAFRANNPDFTGVVMVMCPKGSIFQFMRTPREPIQFMWGVFSSDHTHCR